MLMSRLNVVFIFVSLFLHFAFADSDRISELRDEVVEIRRRIQKEPEIPILFIKLGIALQEINQFRPDGGRLIPEAEEAYRTALELKMSIGMRVLVLGNLGVLLMTANRMNEAIIIMQDCIDIALRNQLSIKHIAGTLFNYGKALDNLGRLKEAEKAYLEVIEQTRGVDSNNFAKAFASLKQFPKNLENEVQCIGKYIVDGSIAAHTCASVYTQWWSQFSQVDKSWILFAAFHSLQHFHDDNSIAQSWKYISRANAIQDTLANYTSNKSTLNLLKSMFPASVFELGSGVDDPTPIFVVGMPRSGSTLLEQALSSHSEIVALGEDTPFAPLVPEIVQASNNLTALKEVGARYISEVKKKVPSEIKAVRTVDKMLNNVLNLGFIKVVLPSACLVHITRHPMDCVLSCYFQPFEGRGTPWAWNLHNIAERYRLIYELHKHWDRVMPSKVLTVHYENLVLDFESEMKKVLNHCGLHWEESVLEFFRNERPVLTASNIQVRQELYKTSIGRWKKYAKYLEPLKELLGEISVKYEERLGNVKVLRDEL